MRSSCAYPFALQERAIAARVLPEVAVSVRIRDAPRELQLYRGDDVEATVDAFLAKHEVAGEDAAQARRELLALAKRKRMVPVLRVPMTFQRKDGAVSRHEFVMHEGEALVEAAKLFVEREGLQGVTSAREVVKKVHSAQ